MAVPTKLSTLGDYKVAKRKPKPKPLPPSPVVLLDVMPRTIDVWGDPLCDRCCDNALDLSTGERYNQREPMLNPKIPPLDLPQPVQTVSYCRCGRRLGAQDPGEACSTCKWMARK